MFDTSTVDCCSSHWAFVYDMSLYLSSILKSVSQPPPLAEVLMP